MLGACVFCSFLVNPTNKIFAGNGADLKETNGGQDSEAAAVYGYPMGVWNVSLLEDFSGVFAGQQNFNEFIGNWDLSAATDMSQMFAGASSFDQGKSL